MSDFDLMFNFVCARMFMVAGFAFALLAVLSVLNERLNQPAHELEAEG